MHSMYAWQEFAKLHAFRVDVSYLPTALLVYVPLYLNLPRAYLPTCLSAYIYFSCLRAFVP